MDDWRSAEATFREFDLVSDRLKKPHPDLLRICVRSIISGFETIAFALKRMATKATVATSVAVSPRERDVLLEYADPPFPGAPPRRIETSMRESLNVAIAVYGRARGSDPPLDKSALGDPAMPKVFSETLAIYDRVTHPEQLTDLDIGRNDVAVLQKTLRWADSLRRWLSRERLAEIAEAHERLNASFEEARQRLLDRQ